MHHTARRAAPAARGGGRRTRPGRHCAGRVSRTPAEPLRKEPALKIPSAPCKRGPAEPGSDTRPQGEWMGGEAPVAQAAHWGSGLRHGPRSAAAARCGVTRTQPSSSPAPSARLLHTHNHTCRLDTRERALGGGILVCVCVCVCVCACVCVCGPSATGSRLGPPRRGGRARPPGCGPPSSRGPRGRAATTCPAWPGRSTSPRRGRRSSPGP